MAEQQSARRQIFRQLLRDVFAARADGVQGMKDFLQTDQLLTVDVREELERCSKHDGEKYLSILALAVEEGYLDGSSQVSVTHVQGAAQKYFKLLKLQGAS